MGSVTEKLMSPYYIGKIFAVRSDAQFEAEAAALGGRDGAPLRRLLGSKSRAHSMLAGISRRRAEAFVKKNTALEKLSLLAQNQINRIKRLF